MKKYVGVMMVLLAATGPVAASPPSYIEQAQLLVVGHLDLGECAITATGGASCTSTLTVSAVNVFDIVEGGSGQYNPPEECFEHDFAEGYPTFGGEGQCSLGNGLYFPGTMTVTLNDPPPSLWDGGCSSWSSALGDPADSGTLSFWDNPITGYHMTAGTLSADLLDHTGIDHWGMHLALHGQRPPQGSSWIIDMGLDGDAYSTTDCNAGDRVSHFTVKLYGLANIASPQ